MLPCECRKCGIIGPAVELWQEHDDNDQPEHRYLWLCGACSDRIVDKHERLYARINRNTPAPGAMALCIRCVHRNARGLCLTARSNGGPGMTITGPKPTVMHIDGRDSAGKRWSRNVRTYSSPPTRCSAHSPLP